MNRIEVLQSISELIVSLGYNYCDIVPELPPLKEILEMGGPVFFITYTDAEPYTLEHPEVIEFTATVTVFTRNFSDKYLQAGTLEVAGLVQMIASELYISQQSMDWDLLGVVRMTTAPQIVDRKSMLQKGAVSFDISTVEDELYDISGYGI